MLNINGWIDGITASGVVMFGIVFGLFFFYRSKKTGARLLSYLGLAIIFAGLMFLGVLSDFLIVLITEHNMNNINGIDGILSYIWFAPALFFAMYIGGELILPKKKWYLISIIVVLSIIFEAVVLIDPIGSFDFAYPTTSGEELIDYNINILTPAGILMACLLLSILIFLGFGFLFKAIQSTGVIRKNFFFLSMGSFCFCVFGLLEGLIAPGWALIIVRIGYLSSFWFMYSGL